jgi:hypothetical protein
VKNRQFTSSKRALGVVSCKWRAKVTERRIAKMLSLQIIGVAGALFAFLPYGMVRTQLARGETEQKAESGTGAATEKAR